MYEKKRNLTISGDALKENNLDDTFKQSLLNLLGIDKAEEVDDFTIYISEVELWRGLKEQNT